MPKRLASTNVLILLCAMYVITYVGRVNVATAAGAFKAERGLNDTSSASPSPCTPCCPAPAACTGRGGTWLF